MAMGKVKVNVNRCKSCGLCVEFCPNNVLSINQDELNEKGYHPAYVKNGDKCIGCAICAIMCPDVALIVERGA